MKFRHLAFSAVLLAACDGEGRDFSGVSSSNLPATKLVFTTQPSNVAVNTPITPAFAVAVQTATGVTVTSSTVQVTIAITSGTGTNGAAATGTLTSGVVNGVATFNNVRVNTAGTGFTLTASAPSLASAVSAAFNVQ